MYLLKTIPTKILLTFALLLSITTVASAATDVNFSTTAVNVAAGESFELAVSLDPHGEKNYTAKLDLSFPADLLELTNFELVRGWIPLQQSGLDLEDNAKGRLIKTAGYVGGFSKPVSFGTVTFTAKDSGTGVITLGDGLLLLDIDNTNSFSGTFPTAAVTVRAGDVRESTTPSEGLQPTCGNNILESGEACDGGAGCTSACELEELRAERELIEQLPPELFDINLELDNTSITNSDELNARVIFVSFGTVPTPVGLTFTIQDATGNIVHTEKDEIIVETEAVKTKQFKNLDLAVGTYTLTLRTLYNTDVEDDFIQSFEITAVHESAPQSSWLFLVPLLLVITGGVWYVWRSKKKLCWFR